MTTNNKYFLKKELATRYRVSISTIERWVCDKIYLLPLELVQIEFFGICKKYSIGNGLERRVGKCQKNSKKIK